MHEEQPLRAARILSRKINVRSFDEIKRLEEKEALKKKKKLEEEGGVDAMMMDEDEKKRLRRLKKRRRRRKRARGATRERRVRGNRSERSGFTDLAFELSQLDGAILRTREGLLGTVSMLQGDFRVRVGEGG